ncbi:MAG: glycosyltransferase family A protein [Planctomycetota bacterium]
MPGGLTAGRAGERRAAPAQPGLAAEPLAGVGVIVIGRNEAPRLRACFDALRDVACPIVYVDSGSHDGSPQVALARGIDTVCLREGPHTAARGRQTGLEHLRARCPELRFVQFVDGDCVLDREWLGHGARFLHEHPEVAVAVGRLRERRAQDSLLIRLVDVDWDLPTGEIDAIGGISMARVAALDQVGGWRTGLVAGEELDLGARLRAAGWKLHRLPADMTFHDIGITRAGELWRRSVRAGFAYAELAWLHGRQRCRRWLRRAASNLVYGGVLPVLFVLALLFWWPGAALIGLAYGVLIARMAWDRVQRGDAWPFALFYGLVLAALKVAGALGTLKYVAVRLSGRGARLIEYKANPATGG